MGFKAAIMVDADSPLRVESLDLAALEDTDVVVRVRATSLCHTDLEAVHGDLHTPLPFVPGHEAAGVVEWVGRSVRSVSVGDHVVTSWNPHCNMCFYCQRQQHVLCQPYREHSARSFHFDGRARLLWNEQPVHQLMYSGSFAELCVVREDCAISVPRDIPFSRACLIGCGVMTGYGAVAHVARVEPGSTVTVIGCGAVGLSAVQGARMTGADRIIAIDRQARRLDVATQLGATQTLMADDELYARHLELTQGRGADYVFEAAGNPAGFRASVDLVRPGGQVVWLGKLPADAEMAFRWGALMGEKRIIRSSYGAAQPEHDFPALAQAYLDGKLKLDEYVTSSLKLEEVNDGLERLATGRDIRSVIEL